jgi:hypothetical protein
MADARTVRLAGEVARCYGCGAERDLADVPPTLVALTAAFAAFRDEHTGCDVRPQQRRRRKA